jgi:Cu2+-exporting ATPase
MKLEILPGPGHGAHDDSHHAVGDFRRRFWVSAVMTVPVLLLSPMIQEWIGLGTLLHFTGDTYILFTLSTMIFVYGGLPFLQGLYHEIKAHNPGMMTLIGLAISIAYFYSSLVVFGLPGSVFFWELATLIDLMLLGHWIEMNSVRGASDALEQLARVMPATAHKVLPDGSMVEVKLAELSPGDRVLVKPGERIPADGKVVEGEAFVDESMLTGESKPVSKKPGSAVIGGSIDGDGSITVHIQRAGSESFIAQVIRLVQAAQESKSKTQELADRAALWLTFIAVGCGLVTLVAWLGVLKADFAFALERMVTVMVITCPHALGLAIPLVIAVSTSLSARMGLLIRNRAAFEKARNIQAVIFDKTGTLTAGLFAITDVLTIEAGIQEETLVSYAAAIESHSSHPIAKAIAASASRPSAVDNFRSIPGAGAEGRVNGASVSVLSPVYVSEHLNLSLDPRMASLQKEGKTLVVVLIDGRIAGAIALADVVRPESKPAVSALRQMGIRCIMLTGDGKTVAEQVAGKLGIDEYFAEVFPADKAMKVKEVQSRGLVVAMVGDGINDAPALAQADVGIAIGAGTDVAIQTADIVLVRSNPMDVIAVINLARATYRKMVENLLWATGYNAVAIPLAAGVLYSSGIWLSPASGAVLMSISTIVVAFNARLLGKRSVTNV